jgi:hypothetical protein
MATISVPFTSGVIADQAIQQRHLSHGIVGADHFDSTWPVIKRGQALSGYFIASTRTVSQVDLGRVCKRALVVFTDLSDAYHSSQNPFALSFNFGALAVGLDHTFNGSLGRFVPYPAVFATQNYQEAMRLTKNMGNEWLDASKYVSGGELFAPYQSSGLYGWYDGSGLTASFGNSGAAAKGILESVWLEGTYLRLAIRSLASSGGPWAFSPTVNIYAI